MERSNNKLGLFGLTCLVVGSIVGGGLFDLMRDMAKGAGPGAVIITWIIVAFGAVCLALSFKNLTMKRPDLNAGMYSYAEAGFGHYMGFNSVLGYWFSTMLGNVGYSALLMSTIAYFMPHIFGNGQNIASIIFASIVLWGGYLLVMQGIKTATFVNTIITIAKLVPIALFILIAIFAFKLNVFTSNFWATPGNKFSIPLIATQVGSTLAVVFWCIDGVESANIYARRAKNRSDVGKATMYGMITVILIYALVTLLSFGVMNRYHLAHLSQPAMGQVLRSIVGNWGAAFVNLGLIIAVLGAWLSWIMLSSAVPEVAAQHHDFPKFFGKMNKKDVDSNSLLATCIIIQIFIFSYLVTQDAYTVCYTIAASAILIPFIFTSMYQIKYTWKNKVNGKVNKRQLTIGIISLIFTVYGLLSIVPKHIFGVSQILMLSLVFALGIPMYCYLQKHENHSKKIFTHKEKYAAFFIVIVAVGTLVDLFI